MPHGTVQTPRDWNRFEIEVEDIESTIDKPTKSNCRFRNGIVTGVGGTGSRVRQLSPRKKKEKNWR